MGLTFAEALFEIQFKPLPVLLLLASATGYSQQSELSIQKNALKAIFQLQKQPPPKHYAAKTDLLKIYPQLAARQEIQMIQEGCFYRKIFQGNLNLF